MPLLPIRVDARRESTPWVINQDNAKFINQNFPLSTPQIRLSDGQDEQGKVFHLKPDKHNAVDNYRH